jgi:plasmid stabilization system protein ParE
MATEASNTPQDNPLERLKLLGGDDAEIARFLDSIEVTSPREREMLYEISRTTPLANVELFPQAHRNMAEALESLARHGYHGTRAGQRLGPLRVVVQWGVRLVARYLVVSHIRNLVTQIRNLYVMREIQSVVGTRERLALTRARTDAQQMFEALKAKEVAVPTFLIGGALIPVVAALGRANGLLDSPAWATAFAIGGVVVVLGASWFILRGAALASRRIRLALNGPANTLWDAVGWCGKPPKDQTRTFVIVALALTFGAWIIIPVLIGIALAT